MNQFNITNPIIEKSFDCAEWCINQHYHFQHNEIVQLLMLPAISLFLFSLTGIMKNHLKHFNNQELGIKLIKIFNLLSVFVLMGFYIALFYLIHFKGVFDFK